MSCYKPLILTVIVLLLGCSETKDEPLPETGENGCNGGILTSSETPTFGFTSQTMLEQFGTNGYSEVQGTISINDGISDLSPLRCLQKVDRLIIQSSTLRSLEGLENLTEVNSLRVLNSGLRNFQGLNSLEKIETFSVSNNTNLETFNGLNSLTTIVQLRISSNDQLVSLDGMENFTTNPERKTTDDQSGAYIRIEFNPLLKSIDGLQNVSGYVESFSVTENPKLEDLGNFKSITHMGAFLFMGNDSAVNIDLFSGVKEIHALIVSDCASVKTVTFPSLDRVGFIEINDCPSFNSLSGLSSLTEAYENLVPSLELDALPSLQTLDGLENLISAAGTVNITTNNLGVLSLTNVCALKKLVENYLGQGSHIPYENHINILTTCSSGNPLLLDFENLCDCN